jgi:predicted P-loop ATPase
LVARAFKPGVKVDTMPVLEGTQGLNKSMALEILGGEWYLALTQKLGGKDFTECLDGGWVIEIPDMSGFKGADIETVKAFVALPFDRYRSAYAHFATTHLRQGVFAASTNRLEWNEDDTGARRFWPLTVVSVNLTLLREIRTALFAEAVYRYRHGEGWWDIPDAAAEQAQRRPEDPWEGKIWQRLKSTYTIFTSTNPTRKAEFALEAGDILTDIGVPVAQQDKKAEIRVTSILKKLGWSKRHCRRHGRKGRYWYPPDLEGNWAQESEKSPP